MFMIRRCPYCNSFLVCWNWVYAFGGNMRAFIEANPHQSVEHLRQNRWGHECWNCDNVITTPSKVLNGIPYWVLNIYGKIKYRVLDKLK